MVPRKSTSDELLGPKMGGVRIGSGLESVIGDPWSHKIHLRRAFGSQAFGSQNGGSCRAPMAPRKSTSDELLVANMGGVRIASGVESVVGDPWPPENQPQTSFWEPKWGA